MLLTQDERDRFATWLELEAETATGIIRQLEKMGPGVAPLVLREKAEAAAALLIARKLRATESVGEAPAISNEVFPVDTATGLQSGMPRRRIGGEP